MKLSYKQALEASLALMELNNLKLPIKSCVQVARLSNLIDAELKVFSRTRDKLVKEYKVSPKHTDDEDTLSFSTALEVDNTEKEKALREFVKKFDELLATETPDWDITIPLPDNISFTPKLLKPIECFVEVVSAS